MYSGFLFSEEAVILEDTPQLLRDPENQLTKCFEPFSLGGDGFCGDTQPSGPCSSLDFLSAADWGRARQAARHLRGGASGVGRPVSGEVLLPGLQPPPSSVQQAPRGKARQSARDCDLGLAAASKELVTLALDDGLHDAEGWLDLGQMAEAVDELVCAVWSGDTVRSKAKRAETFRHLSCRLAGFWRRPLWSRAFGKKPVWRPTRGADILCSKPLN